MNNLPTLFPTHISASMLDDLKCPMFFFRRNIQHLKSSAKNPDLIAGGHIAKGCETVRNAFFTEGLSETEAIELGIEYILEAEDTGDSTKSNENIAFCLRQYFKKFRLSETFPACALSDGTHAVEYKFQFDLGIPHPDLEGVNLQFTGKLDYLCEDVTLRSTKRYVLDEKTCKSVFRVGGSKTIDYQKELAQYKTSTQLIAYHWAARKLGVSTESSLIRRIPIMSTFEESFELEVPITQWQINTWEKGLYKTLVSLVEDYKSYKRTIVGTKRSVGEIFPMAGTGTACMNYSRPCMYQEGCLSEDGEVLLSEKYMQKVYDRKNHIEVSLQDYMKTIGDKNG